MKPCQHIYEPAPACASARQFKQLLRFWLFLIQAAKVFTPTFNQATQRKFFYLSVVPATGRSGGQIKF